MSMTWKERGAAIKSFFMTTTNGMALGLFGTLIIGVIINLFARIPNLELIGEFAKVVQGLMGAGIGFHAAHSFKHITDPHTGSRDQLRIFFQLNRVPDLMGQKGGKHFRVHRGVEDDFLIRGVAKTETADPRFKGKVISRFFGRVQRFLSGFGFPHRIESIVQMLFSELFKESV